MRALRWLWLSLMGKIAILIVVFVAVPLLLLNQFRQADEARKDFLLSGLDEQGRLVGTSLAPVLDAMTPQEMARLNPVVSRLAGGSRRIKVLYRKSPDEGFFFVAAAPTASFDYLDRDLQRIVLTGELSRIGRACESGMVGWTEYVNPTGEEEILTSLTGIATDNGCWVVLTSQSAADSVGARLLRPYWQEPDIRFAAVAYIVLAAVAIMLVLSVRANLEGFARTAHRLRSGRNIRRSFRESNSIPELGGVAGAFDDLVDALRSAADSVKMAAEENAHALKGPIGIVRQALEPLRQRVSKDDDRAVKALETIDLALDRLNDQVSKAQRGEETIAATINPRQDSVDIAGLTQEIARIHDGDVEVLPAGTMRAARGDAALIRTCLENLIENAVSFSPEGSKVRVRMASHNRITVTVDDDGPGVPADSLERIFDQHYSSRAKTAEKNLDTDPINFGLGLWIVKRNVTAMGGTVRAENRAEGGFSITMELNPA